MIRILFYAACLMSIALPVRADYPMFPMPPNPLAAGWKYKEFDHKSPLTFRGENGVLRMTGINGVSAIYKAVDVDLRATPIMRWRWRVDRGAPPTDLRKVGGDDRNITIIVSFQWDQSIATDAELGVWRVMQMSNASAPPNRVIHYIWGGTQKIGESFNDPYTGPFGRYVIMRNGASDQGVWVNEAVDVMADYRRLFGGNPPPINQIMISADGDDTQTQIDAQVAELSFQPQ